jgi:DNA-binding transcriptional LysR family regulator
MRAIDATRAGAATVRDFELGRAGELTVGATHAICTYVLPEVLTHFRRRCPTVRVLVRSGTSEEIDELVMHGDAHIGLVRDHRVDHLSKVPLYSEELVLVAHANHQLAGSNPVTVADLLESTLILLDRRWASSGFLLELFSTAGDLPVDTIEIESVELGKQLVNRGLGVAMLPMTAISREIASGEFVRLPLEGERNLVRRVLLVERPAPPSWAPLDNFRTLLREIPNFVAGTVPFREPSVPDLSEPVLSLGGANGPGSRS